MIFLKKIQSLILLLLYICELSEITHGNEWKQTSVTNSHYEQTKESSPEAKPSHNIRLGRKYAVHQRNGEFLRRSKRFKSNHQTQASEQNHRPRSIVIQRRRSDHSQKKLGGTNDDIISSDEVLGYSPDVSYMGSREYNNKTRRLKNKPNDKQMLLSEANEIMSNNVMYGGNDFGKTKKIVTPASTVEIKKKIGCANRENLPVNDKKRKPEMIRLDQLSNGTNSSDYDSPPLLLPTQDIQPLDDHFRFQESLQSNRSRDVAPESKKPYFDLKSDGNANKYSLECQDNGSAVSGGSEGLLSIPLTCYTCNESMGEKCYNMTDAADDIPTEQCNDTQKFCMVSRVWFNTKEPEQNNTQHQFSIERGCMEECEPYCILMGDRNRLEIFACRSCCNTQNCNVGNKVPHCSHPSHALLAVVIVTLVLLRGPATRCCYISG